MQLSSFSTNVVTHMFLEGTQIEIPISNLCLFSVSIDDVWKILAFTQKKNAIDAVKNFLLMGIDYQIGTFNLLVILALPSTVSWQHPNNLISCCR